MTWSKASKTISILTTFNLALRTHQWLAPSIALLSLFCLTKVSIFHWYLYGRSHFDQKYQERPRNFQSTVFNPLFCSTTWLGNHIKNFKTAHLNTECRVSERVMTLSDKDVLDADYFNFRRLFAIPLTIPVLLNTFRVIFTNSVSTERS